MTAYKKRPSYLWLMIAVLLMGLIGCSTDTPLDSSSDLALAADKVLADTPPPPNGVTQFVAELTTIDVDLRQLTFVNHDELVIAAEDCEFVQIVAGVETLIEIGDLEVGMLLKVCGDLQEDGSVLARKIVEYVGNECFEYDLAFRDTIISIDYAAGIFKTANRTEVIMVDENTNIWGFDPEPKYDSENGGSNHGSTSGSDDGRSGLLHETFEFGSLKVGYILEIKANIVDEATLLAVSIKIANSIYRQSVEFEATLASIDYIERTVTFEGNEWQGSICLGAELLSVDSEPIVLEDFATGDLVYVKGMAMKENLLRIGLMGKV